MNAALIKQFEVLSLLGVAFKIGIFYQSLNLEDKRLLVLTRQRIECAGDDHAGNEHGQDDVFSLSIISLKPEYI